MNPTHSPIYDLPAGVTPRKAAPFLPMSRKEMDDLGWDECDIILVTGDAYIDHPSFGMALLGRLLEAQGFRVGIISQPDWTSADQFKQLGKPRLYFGVTSGNMDSMINRYTADKKPRSDDAYTAGGLSGKRPDRALNVYCQRCALVAPRHFDRAEPDETPSASLIWGQRRVKRVMLRSNYSANGACSWGIALKIMIIKAFRVILCRVLRFALAGWRAKTDGDRHAAQQPECTVVHEDCEQRTVASCAGAVARSGKAIRRAI
jgi:hypothetical protein